MALGKIKADTLEHSTAGSVDTQYVVRGSTKVWINAPAAKNSINDSLNVSSLDDDGTGDFGLHYTASFESTYYCFSPGVDDGGTTTAVIGCDGTNGTYASGSADFETFYVNSSNNRTMTDQYSFLMFTGDLA